MRISSALLCDFAAVRESLLTVVSAGITRVSPPMLPGQMGLYVALVIEVDPAQRPLPHEVRLDITGPDGSVIGKVRGAFQVGPGEFDPEEPTQLPVPLDLRTMRLPLSGWYAIEIAVDAEAPAVIRFKVLEPARSDQIPAPGDATLVHGSVRPN